MAQRPEGGDRRLPAQGVGVVPGSIGQAAPAGPGRPPPRSPMAHAAALRPPTGRGRRGLSTRATSGWPTASSAARRRTTGSGSASRRATSVGGELVRPGQRGQRRGSDGGRRVGHVAADRGAIATVAGHRDHPPSLSGRKANILRHRTTMMVDSDAAGGRRRRTRVSHMVIYRSADGKAAFQQVDDLNAAVAFVEKIRNDAGVENSRIYRMELVNYRFEPYYQVRLDSGELLGGPPGRVLRPPSPGGGPPPAAGAPPDLDVGPRVAPPCRAGRPARSGLGAPAPPGGGRGCARRQRCRPSARLGLVRPRRPPSRPPGRAPVRSRPPPAPTRRRRPLRRPVGHRRRSR